MNFNFDRFICLAPVLKKLINNFDIKKKSSFSSTGEPFFAQIYRSAFTDMIEFSVYGFDKNYQFQRLFFISFFSKTWNTTKVHVTMDSMLKDFNYSTFYSDNFNFKTDKKVDVNLSYPLQEEQYFQQYSLHDLPTEEEIDLYMKACADILDGFDEYSFVLTEDILFSEIYETQKDFMLQCIDDALERLIEKEISDVFPKIDSVPKIYY